MAEKDKIKKKIFKEAEKIREEVSKTEKKQADERYPEEKKAEELSRKKEEVADKSLDRTSDKTAVQAPQPATGVATEYQPKRAQQPHQLSQPRFFSLIPRGRIIRFMERRRIAYVFSTLLFLFSSFIVFSGRVPLGVDFKGGLSGEVKFHAPVDTGDIRAVLPEASIQSLGEGRFLIKLPLSFIEEERTPEGLKKDPAQVLSERIKALGRFEILKVETVGSIIGRELRQRGIMALVLGLLGIFIYITFRFEWRFAFGAVLALIHDVMITLGIISVFGVELSLVTLAGLLTLAGYSVNDSVIVADRIREKLRFLKGFWNTDTINKAIVDTLPRTIITSLTTLFPSISLILFGGEVLRELGITFTVGVIVGTYSSIFICSAVAYDIYLAQLKRKEAISRRRVQPTVVHAKTT